MPLPPAPVLRALVPPAAPAPPDGFTRVDAAVTASLPFRVALEGDTALLLVLPTGLAATWRDADPAAVVSLGRWETAPRPTGAPTTPPGSASRPPLTLLLQRGGTTLASAPVTAGVVRGLPAEAGVAFEVVVLDWEVRAGNLRGPGDFGSRVSLAWRRADRGTDTFEPPPVHPEVARRVPAQERIDSAVGSAPSRQPARFRARSPPGIASPRSRFASGGIPLESTDPGISPLTRTP